MLAYHETKNLSLVADEQRLLTVSSEPSCKTKARKPISILLGLDINPEKGPGNSYSVC